MSTLEERLSSASAAAREHELAQDRIRNLQRRIAELMQLAQQQRTELEDEQDDVERLEGVSLTRIVVAVRGNRGNAVTRERAGADAARLRLAHTEAQVAALDRSLASEQSHLAGLADAPQRLADVLEEKEKFLREIGDQRADRLFELAEEEGRLNGDVRELSEAVTAAQQADDALRHAAMSLDSASSWSTHDTFLGGGAMSSAMKHSKLDDAADATTRADQYLAVLRSELADVSDSAVAATQVSIESGTRFVDIWFDNLFTDLAVRDQIKQAQQNVARAAESVAEVMSGLAERAHTTRDRLHQIDEERRRILTEQTPPS